MKKNIKAFSLVELAIVMLIIAIALAGITQASRLIQQFRLRNAQNQTSNSPVPSIPGLIAWWETTSEDSFDELEQEDGTKISNWYNINPTILSSYDLEQNTDDNKPTYQEKSINFLPALQFDGANTVMETAFASELNPESFTIFTVTQISSASGYGAVFSSRSDPYNGKMLYVTPTSDYQIWLGNGSSTWNGDILPTSAITVGNNTILSATYAAAASEFKLYDNGSLLDTVTATYAPAATNAFRVGAGRNESDPDYYLDGFIGEIIIFNRKLDDAQRVDVEEYLAKKWGISIS